MTYAGAVRGMQTIRVPGCTVTFDGQFITINHSGNVLTNRQGRKEISLHFSEITSVDYTPARFGQLGKLAFTASGYDNVQTRHGFAGWDSMENPLAISFGAGANEAANELYAAVMHAKYGAVPARVVERAQAAATPRFSWGWHITLGVLTAGLSVPYSWWRHRHYRRDLTEAS